MANFHFKNIGISALSSCVPAAISKNYEALRGVVPEEEISKTIDAIGIAEKRFVDEKTCASDLCFRAAEKIFSETKIPRESVDVLLFMSQTGDFKIPATAPLLQNRLKLSQNCAALDLSLGCSGFIYALSTAFAFANIPEVNRVLLLVGETFSKIVNPKDRVNAPLYGDAGTAALIEKNSDFVYAHFFLKSDGEGENSVKIPAGGCRVPANSENLKTKIFDDGSARSENEIFMDGMDVFNFAIRCVPAVIKELATFSGTNLSEIDAVIFHQANKMMTDFLAARLKIPPEKVPYSLGKFGNTSSASIPLTISECLGNEEISANKKTAIPRGNVILCGFGAGLSWGAAKISLCETKIFRPIEF